MKYKELQNNSEILYFGKKFKIVAITPPTVILQRNGDRELLEVNYVDLVTKAEYEVNKHTEKEEKEETITNKPNLLSIPDKKREEVSKRYEMIKPILILERAQNKDIRYQTFFLENYKEFMDDEDIGSLHHEKLLELTSKKYGKSKRTLQRYLADYRKAESDAWGEEGLIPRTGTSHTYRKDNKTIEICHPHKPEEILCVLNVRIDEKYIPIIKRAIERDYLTKKSISNKAVYDIIEANCMKEGLEPLKEITVSKILGRIDPRIKTRYRAGKKDGEILNDVERGFTNEAKYPLHIVAIDHTELDMEVVDEATRLPMGRPWITLGIDLFTRGIWCLYVSFENPSINRVRKALMNGIFFKRVKEKYNTINEWEIFGKPSIIQLDNGPEFKSGAVKRMINETLEAEVMYRPVRTPRFGGTIERHFGTINSELIHRLDGTRKSNPGKLGDYNPDEEAKLTLKDITELLTIYITDIYHYSKHTGLPLSANTPMARFYDGLRIAGYPEYVDSKDEELFKKELLPTIMRAYTRDGVRLNTVTYRSSVFHS